MDIMRIGTISDLHIDRTSQYSIEDFISGLVQELRMRAVDILLIAGDISNDHQKSYDFIKRLKTEGVTVYFVPGNHDFWSDEAADDILNFFISKAECLIAAPLILNDEWAVAGHCGWYNYAYGSSKFTDEQFERGKYKGSTWQDKVRLNWQTSDKVVSRRFAAQLKEDIAQLGSRKIIMMTHIVSHPGFTVPMPNRIFDFYNAYIGTSDLDAIYQTADIRYSIMGHVHFRSIFKEADTTYICPCLGYTREWRTKQLKHELHHAMHVIEIN